MIGDKVRGLISTRLVLHRAFRRRDPNKWTYGCRNNIARPESETLIIEVKEDGIPILPKTALTYCRSCWDV